MRELRWTFIAEPCIQYKNFSLAFHLDLSLASIATIYCSDNIAVGSEDLTHRWLGAFRSFEGRIIITYKLFGGRFSPAFSEVPLYEYSKADYEFP